MACCDGWDFWDDAKILSGYDNHADRDLINVFIETTKKENWYSEIADRLKLDESYVRLLIEILCSVNYCEYGTSPRSAWAVHDTYNANLAKLKYWYNSKWEDEF